MDRKWPDQIVAHAKRSYLNVHGRYPSPLMLLSILENNFPTFEIV